MREARPIDVKICGIRTPDIVEAAVAGGARYVGFVFYPPSPRSVEPLLAASLARAVPTGVRAVGLFVDPTDEELARVLGTVPLDMIQLSGGETPRRVHEIKTRWGLPVIKSVPVGTAADLEAAAGHAEIADRLLFDARPPKGPGALPGGNGVAFDWSLLAGRRWQVPWMLAGGLTPDNVAGAIAATGAAAVDVSSGVETAPGAKSAAKVAAFLAAASGRG